MHNYDFQPKIAQQNLWWRPQLLAWKSRSSNDEFPFHRHRLFDYNASSLCLWVHLRLANLHLPQGADLKSPKTQKRHQKWDHHSGFRPFTSSFGRPYRSWIYHLQRQDQLKVLVRCQPIERKLLESFRNLCELNICHSSGGIRNACRPIYSWFGWRRWFIDDFWRERNYVAHQPVSIYWVLMFFGLHHSHSG